MLDTVHTLLSKIQKTSQKFKISNYVLSENMEDRLEYPLTSAYILYLYELYRQYISDQDLETQKVENYWKVIRCVIANTRRGVLVLVDFQNNYYSVDYWIIYQLVYLGQLSEVINK